MKYYDMHYLFANCLDVFALYMLPGENNYQNIALLCFFTNFIMSLGILKFPKVKET